MYEGRGEEKNHRPEDVFSDNVYMCANHVCVRFTDVLGYSIYVFNICFPILDMSSQIGYL